MELTNECPVCYMNEFIEILPCQHELCSLCCIQLITPLCPLCRQEFTFTVDELYERRNLGLNNDWTCEKFVELLTYSFFILTIIKFF